MRVRGFAIPFAFFWDYLEENRVPWTGETFHDTVREVFAHERFRLDPAYRRNALRSLQRIVYEQGRVSDAVVRRVVERIEDVFGSPLVKVRFRSSSNAEDSAFFPGAGLYDSYSACAGDTLDGDDHGPCLCDREDGEERLVEDALRKVWASFWNVRAVEERLWYGIREDDAGMAIVVTPTFLDEHADGIALTGHPLVALNDGIVVTAQPGGRSAARPEPGEVPEVDILYGRPPDPFQIFRSQQASPWDGDDLLTDDELVRLGGALADLDLARPIFPPLPRELVRLDVEFKVDRERRLRIKQVRPYLLGGSGFLYETLIQSGRSVTVPGVRWRPVWPAGTSVWEARDRTFSLELASRSLEIGGNSHPSLVRRLELSPRRREAFPDGSGEVFWDFDLAAYGLPNFSVEALGRQSVRTQAGGRFDVELALGGLDVDVGRRTSSGDLSVRAVTVTPPGISALPAASRPEKTVSVECELAGGGYLEVRVDHVLSGRCLWPSAARGRVGGEDFSVGDELRLTATKNWGNVRESYLVDTAGVTLDFSSVCILFRIGVSTPEILLERPGGDVVPGPGVLSWSVRTIPSGQDAQFRRGDADADGEVALADAVLLLDWLFTATGELPCPDAADINDDGALTVSDAVGLARSLFSGEPVPGGAACNHDATEDALGRCRYSAAWCW